MDADSDPVIPAKAGIQPLSTAKYANHARRSSLAKPAKSAKQEGEDAVHLAIFAIFARDMIHPMSLRAQRGNLDFSPRRLALAKAGDAKGHEEITKGRNQQLPLNRG
jgi:hypothetical protein